MADASAIAAALTKYNALTAANFPSSTRPPLFFDEAPAENTAGAQLQPPFVVMKDNGMTPSFNFESQVLETTELVLEVYAERLADVDTTVLAIRYNGGTIAARTGFDFGSFSGLASGLTNYQIQLAGERRFMTGFGKTSQLIHGCELSYRVTLQRQ